MPAYFFHLAFETSTTGAATAKACLDSDFHHPALFADKTKPLSVLSPAVNSGKVTLEEHCVAKPSNAPPSNVETSEADLEDLSSDGTKPIRPYLRPAGPRDLSEDWRFDKISIESMDMESKPSEISLESAGSMSRSEHASKLATSGLAIRARYVPTKPVSNELGSGVVHLYRDPEPSSILSEDGGDSVAHQDHDAGQDQAYVDDKSTTLCILAVPSYMTPSDLLGWVGEDALNDISHFRLVRTSRSNKYLVLIKLREASKAKQWQRTWNGKLFNSMEVGFSMRWPKYSFLK